MSSFVCNCMQHLEVNFCKNYFHKQNYLTQPLKAIVDSSRDIVEPGV